MVGTKIVINIRLSCILNCIAFIDFSIGSSNLYFDTVAVYLCSLESPTSKNEVSVVYGILIVTTVVTCISWPLLLEFLFFIAFCSDVLIHFKCQNNFILKLFRLCAHFYRRYVSTNKLYAAKTEFNIFTAYFFSYRDYLNRTVNTTNRCQYQD